MLQKNCILLIFSGMLLISSFAYSTDEDDLRNAAKDILAETPLTPETREQLERIAESYKARDILESTPLTPEIREQLERIADSYSNAQKIEDSSLLEVQQRLVHKALFNSSDEARNRVKNILIEENLHLAVQQELAHRATSVSSSQKAGESSFTVNDTIQVRAKVILTEMKTPIDPSVQQQLKSIDKSGTFLSRCLRAFGIGR